MYLDKKIILKLFLLATLFVLPMNLSAQKIGIKANALPYLTGTPNLGLDVKISNKFTFGFEGQVNPFVFQKRHDYGTQEVTPQWRHWMVMPEVKYWFCKSFERHNIGLHALGGQYNAGGISFIDVKDIYRYDGFALGGGLSYGYQWALGSRWGMEASIGVGYIYFKYKKYDCDSCDDYVGRYRSHYFGPTKAALTFVYYIK